jgi:prepilin-type processing-associated H-X9-DG protein/prepilin-type N-terminal cleavage/methylation domain-containing protein
VGGRNRHRSFTLIELLVVVAIIAALMAILISSLSAAKAKARRAQCCANIRSLAQCDFMYSQEFGVYSRDSGLINNQIFPTVFWLLATDQHVPLTFPTSPTEAEFADTYRRVQWFKCPLFPRQDQPVCFVVNAYDPDHPGAKLPYLRATRILSHSETCNFTEANVNIPMTTFDLFDVWMTGHIEPNLNTPDTGDSPAGRISSDERHGKLINMSFYDGHVESRDVRTIELRNFINR